MTRWSVSVSLICSPCLLHCMMYKGIINIAQDLLAGKDFGTETVILAILVLSLFIMLVMI